MIMRLLEIENYILAGSEMFRNIKVSLNTLLVLKIRKYEGNITKGWKISIINNSA